jgi:hypothetical protein
MSSGSKSLEKAEKRAFSTLLLSDQETAQWSQRLIDAFGSGELGVVLWAVVRFLGPGADSHKKLKWERSFANLPEKGGNGGVLGAFKASFIEYVLQDVPVVLQRQDFHAVMRDNPYKDDFKQYTKIVNFLEDQNCAWTITCQRVHAYKDPRRALPKAFFAQVDWFFGGRVEYSLIEYCLVLDIPETQLRRSLNVSPSTSHKLLSALMSGVHEKDSPPSSSSSSNTNLDMTFEMGGGSASGSMTKRKASPIVSSPIVRSTTASSSSLTLTRIPEKSLSVSSSGKPNS